VDAHWIRKDEQWDQRVESKSVKSQGISARQIRIYEAIRR